MDRSTIIYIFWGRGRGYSEKSSLFLPVGSREGRGEGVFRGLGVVRWLDSRESSFFWGGGGRRGG